MVSKQLVITERDVTLPSGDQLFANQAVIIYKFRYFFNPNYMQPNISVTNGACILRSSGPSALGRARYSAAVQLAITLNCSADFIDSLAQVYNFSKCTCSSCYTRLALFTVLGIPMELSSNVSSAQVAVAKSADSQLWFGTWGWSETASTSIQNINISHHVVDPHAPVLIHGVPAFYSIALFTRYVCNDIFSSIVQWSSFVFL